MTAQEAYISEYEDAKRQLLVQREQLGEQRRESLSSQERALSDFLDTWRWLEDANLTRKAQMISDDVRDITNQQFKTADMNIAVEIEELETQRRIVQTRGTEE